MSLGCTCVFTMCDRDAACAGGVLKWRGRVPRAPALREDNLYPNQSSVIYYCIHVACRKFIGFVFSTCKMETIKYLLDRMVWGWDKWDFRRVLVYCMYLINESCYQYYLKCSNHTLYLIHLSYGLTYKL